MEPVKKKNIIKANNFKILQDRMLQEHPRIFVRFCNRTTSLHWLLKKDEKIELWQNKKMKSICFLQN